MSAEVKQEKCAVTPMVCSDLIVIDDDGGGDGGVVDMASGGKSVCSKV